nr:hypothetical protein B0A51_04514 [Rachicladosporium sp. CCFEE 5018]
MSNQVPVPTSNNFGLVSASAQELRLFQVGGVHYLAEPVPGTFHVPGLDVDIEDVALVTIIESPVETHADYHWLQHTVEAWLEYDDVFRPEFLANVVFSGIKEPSDHEIARLSEYMHKRWGTTSLGAVVRKTAASDVRAGPYVSWRGELCAVYRLYDDTNLAFTVAIKPGKKDSSGFQNLRLGSDYYTALSVAVPSRIESTKAVHPLSGLRFAVKDIFDIEGMRITAGCRAFFDLSRTSATTAPAIQILLDHGASLVGALKLGSLITREEPTESADYHAPFNPRGDGYQSAWSSSGGCGAAIAAYEWLDFTIASDTTGSSRRPAMANGIFQHRLTADIVSKAGMVPSWTPFDSPALFGRDFSQFERIVGTWTGQKRSQSSKSPITLLYPSDFWPVENAQQMELVSKFIADFEEAHNVKIQPISIAHKWHATKPAQADTLSLQDYLDDVGVDSFCYGVYHELDWFRDEYKARFHKDPYVNPVMQWRWDASQNVTKEEHARAVEKLHVYRDWILKEIMQNADDNTFIILPVTKQEVDYRDVPPSAPGPPSAFDGIWLAPTLGAPELTIPIGEMEYSSRVSGNTEYIPIVVSVLGSPGSDMNLLATVRKVLESAQRPMVVQTGSRLFGK